MNRKTKKTTRRQFLETTTAVAAGTALAAASGKPAAAKAKGRAHYEIFQPGQIGKMKLKHRLCRSAAYMNTGSYDPATAGEVTDDSIRIFKTYAENEVALDMTGYMAVMDYGKKPTHICASHDKFIPGLARLADAVHGVGNGCKMVAEIGHDGTATGIQGRDSNMISPTGIEWPARISPSGISGRGGGENHALSAAEVERFCTDMGEATRRLKEAGWDGCNIHGAHGYLIHTFLSARTNKRTDKYGGSIEKRVEIVREIVEKMRDQAGADFAIIIKLNCDIGRTEGGVEEAYEVFRTIAKLVEAAGVDAIDISGANAIRSNIDDPEDQSYFKDYSAKLDNITIPVMLSGGNRHVDLLEDIFKKQEGKVDFFNFARPLIRQPDLIKQWLEGGNPKSECTNDSLCFRALYNVPPRPAYCVQLERERLEAEKEARALAGNDEGTFGA